MARLNLSSILCLVLSGCSSVASRAPAEHPTVAVEPAQPAPPPSDGLIVEVMLPDGWSAAKDGIPCCTDRLLVHAATGARIAIYVGVGSTVPVQHIAEKDRAGTLQMQAYQASPLSRILGGTGYTYRWRSTAVGNDGRHPAGGYMVLNYPARQPVSYSCTGTWTTEAEDRVSEDFTQICLSVKLSRQPCAEEPL